MPNDFENELSAGLKGLATEAPPAPSGALVAARLRRRARWRRDSATALAVVALSAAALLLVREGATQRPSAPALLAAGGPAPLAVSAPALEIEKAVRAYFESIGATGGAVVIKEKGEGLSCAFAGEVRKPPEKLQAELSELFKNFDSASVEFRHGRLVYTLVAGGRSPGRVGGSAQSSVEESKT